MGFLSRLFGKGNDAPLSDSPPIEGPPELIHAVELQKAYWTYDPVDQTQLEERGLNSLSWPERLRLHHLNCLQRITPGAEPGAAERCLQTLVQLAAPDSPYRARSAMLWQGQPLQSGNDREPEQQGALFNPSFTHLGTLEVIRLDADNQPASLEFIGFDELRGLMFAPPSMFRAAKIFFEDGREEIVLAPLLYGVTWQIGNEYDRSGSMTRFVAHLDREAAGTLDATGIGVGQQDLSVRNEDQGVSLFGLGSVAEISFPLDMRDPRFDEKARARGLDPVEIRSQMGS